MRVEVISAFWANGRVHHVGDEVDLADGFAQELMFSRRVIPAKPRAKPKRAKAPAPSSTTPED